jgi:oligopeptide/dipeptide ABC transporter ATP-binding protein
MPSPRDDSVLLAIEDLYITFRTSRGVVRALNGVSLDVSRGEIFGIVGESGCGKSITGMSVLGLLPGSAEITRGAIFFEGRDLRSMSDAQLRAIRGHAISMIFQDPATALNPVFTIGHQIEKVLRTHTSLDKRAVRTRALETLDAVGLPDVERIYTSYPHQLSGGMQQRALIAIAISCEPTLIIADEPTTALDVTIQSQILTLLTELRRRLGIALILITHNLGVVAETCDRLAVFYAGRVVERGTTDEVFTRPLHPYTRGLMAAIPVAANRGGPLAAIPGTVPSDPGLLPGCTFAPRCAHAIARCTAARPDLYSVGSGEHAAACFLLDDTLDCEATP